MFVKKTIRLKENTEIRSNTLLRKINHSTERHNNTLVSHLSRKDFIDMISALMGRIYLRRCNKVGKRPKTRCWPYIKNMGTISIGDDIYINSRKVQTDLVSGPEGILEIGNKVSIGFGVSIVARKEIKIGDRVSIGPYTMIYDSDFHMYGEQFQKASDEPVIIEDDVRLTSKVVVLKGSRIGKGSQIMAGSVVSGIIPPYVVAGGIPAKVIKYLDPSPNSGFYWEHSDREPVIREDISHRVRKIASEIFSTDIELIGKKYSHYSVSNWNSLQHVKFIHALEREFDIRLKKEDWTRISSIGKIARVIQKYVDRKNKGHKSIEIKI